MSKTGRAQHVLVTVKINIFNGLIDVFLPNICGGVGGG